jgi:hypothetical protein
MYDKRVVRGSTHAAMVIPAGSYPDTLFKGGSPGKSTMDMKRSSLKNVIISGYIFLVLILI